MNFSLAGSDWWPRSFSYAVTSIAWQLFTWSSVTDICQIVLMALVRGCSSAPFGGVYSNAPKLLTKQVPAPNMHSRDEQFDPSLESATTRSDRACWHAICNHPTGHLEWIT